MENKKEWIEKIESITGFTIQHVLGWCIGIVLGGLMFNYHLATYTGMIFLSVIICAVKHLCTGSNIVAKTKLYFNKAIEWFKN